MRILRFFPGILLLAWLHLALAQTPAPNSALRIEGREPLIVTYLPRSPGANIKHPQKLSLEVVVNNGQGPVYGTGTRSVPFVRMSADAWKATLTRQSDRDIWLYLIFMVKDQTSGQVDDNGGQYWDYVANPQGLEMQVSSYRGKSFENGIGRARDMTKATAILSEAVNAGQIRMQGQYWWYKVERDGNTDEAWGKLAAEVDDFLDTHQSDKSALAEASRFINEGGDRLPPQLLAKATGFMKALDPAASADVDEEAAYDLADSEKDRRKSAEMLAEFVQKYPHSERVPVALDNLFVTYWGLDDVAGAEATFRHITERYPSSPLIYLEMANVYIDEKVKIEEALRLLNKTEELNRAGRHREGQAAMIFSPSVDPRRNEADLAYLRARAYLLQGQGELALPLAQKALEFRRDAAHYFVVAQAFEATGRQQEALDSYLRAVLLPSRDHDYAQYKARLEQYWVDGGFGTAEELPQKIRSFADASAKQGN